MTRQEAIDRLTPIFHDLLTAILGEPLALVVIAMDLEGTSTVGNLPPAEMLYMLERAMKRVSENEPDRVTEKPRPH